MKRILLLVAIVVASLGGSSLYAQGPDAGDGKKVVRQPISGQVTVINAFTGQVTIRTQEVPGLEGKSTTVPYFPKNKEALAQLHEGDHVKGDLVVSGSDTYMENIVVTGSTRSDSKTDSAAVKRDSARS